MHTTPIRALLRIGMGILLCGCLAGCASIFSGGPKKVTVNTQPPGAKVTVYDKTGKVILTNQTPAVLRLDRSNGYFKGEDYQMVNEKPGYKRMEDTVESPFRCWYYRYHPIIGCHAHY